MKKKKGKVNRRRLVGLRFLFKGGAVVLLLFLLSNAWVILRTRHQIIDDLNTFDSAVLLVLGTSKSTLEGTPNQFFEARIQKAAEAFHSGQVDFILVSGDNRTRYYNEPQDMKNALGKRGIPKESILMDAAGFRTIDSIKRAKDVFGQDKIVIITQTYHAYRALYIADRYGIDARALPAEYPSDAKFSTWAREWMARPWMLIELHILLPLEVNFKTMNF